MQPIGMRALRTGIVLSILASLSITPTKAQIIQEPPLRRFPTSPFPIPPVSIIGDHSEFSTSPMPPLPPEVVFPPESRIINPEVKARYYIDVTHYGAQSGITFDSTPGIQRAINAACDPAYVNPDYTIRPILFFPPGLFQIFQPQLPSTDSPLQITCTLEIEGSGYNSGAQFSELAPGSWILTEPGAHPNAAAALTFTTIHPIIRNMNIAGVNQALAVYNAAPGLLEDVCLSALVTGMADNTPLKVSDSFAFWYRGGCLQTYSSDVPTAIFTGEQLPNIPNAEELVGLTYISDLFTAGGGFKYIQRVSASGVLMGNFVFRNITMEDANDAFEITQECSSGCPDWRMSSVTFDHVGVADSNCFTCAVINMNAPDLHLSGVLIHNSYAGKSAGRAITVNSGLLEDHYVDFCAYACSNAVVDGYGDPIWNYSGQVTLSGGTATLQYAPVSLFGHPPVCVPNDETTIGGAKITAGVFSMTITGGPSDVVDFACFFSTTPIT